MAEPGQRGSGGPPAELEEESRSSGSALARLCALCTCSWACSHSLPPIDGETEAQRPQQLCRTLLGVLRLEFKSRFL